MTEYNPEKLNHDDLWDKEELQAHEREKRMKVSWDAVTDWNTQTRMQYYEETKKILKEIENLSFAKLKELNPDWQNIIKEASYVPDYYE